MKFKNKSTPLFINNRAFIVNGFIQSIVHCQPLLFPSFLVPHECYVGIMLHRPNLWYLHMMGSAAQTRHVPSTGMRDHWKDQCLVNKAGELGLPNFQVGFYHILLFIALSIDNNGSFICNFEEK